MRNATIKIKSMMLLLSAVGLVGCGGHGLDRLNTASVMPDTIPNPGFEHSTTEEVPLSRAFVLFPDAVGEPVGVFETSHSNGILQKVVYYGEPATPGENFIDIRAVRGSGKSKAGANALTLHNNSARELQIALGKVMPNAHMHLSPLVESNAYGTFGYALGTEYDGQNCIFAWQSIKGQVKAFDGLFRRFKNDNRAISIRVRFCRSTFSRQNLVSMIRGMRIVLDPKDLEKREVVRWQGTGQGINSFGNPEAFADGYISEGVAGPNAVEFDQGIADAPIVRSAPHTIKHNAPKRVTTAAPRKTTPRVTKPSKKIERKPILPKRKKVPEPNYMERDDLNNLDPSERIEVQTIYVDPRQYATVPSPDELTGAPSQPASQNISNNFNATRSRVAPVRSVGQTGAGSGNGTLVPTPDSSMIPNFDNQTTSSAMDDNLGTQSDQEGARAGLPSNVGNLKTSEWDRNNSSSGATWAPDSNAGSEKDWTNDVARNVETGKPLGRPCGVIRDSSCQ